jgi:hypothetical protein
MRSYRMGVLIQFLLLGTPLCAQQSTSTATQPVSDPQAVAVVQAAITALGGAAAISQAQSWTFQAQTQGAHSNGTVDYIISTHTDTGQMRGAGGAMKPAPLIHSHFVPALVGAILVKESQDPTFTIHYQGTSTIDSKIFTSILFTSTGGSVSFPAQVWIFDQTNLPVLIDFNEPAEIGAHQSFPVRVTLSNYQTVSGVLYPFRISTLLPGKPLQIIALQSISTSPSVPVNEFNGPAGDLQ